MESSGVNFIFLFVFWMLCYDILLYMRLHIVTRESCVSYVEKQQNLQVSKLDKSILCRMFFFILSLVNNFH